MLEDQKTKATNHLLVLNRRIDEFQGTLNTYESPLAQKTGGMTYMNQESRMIVAATSYPHPNADWYSLALYTHE
jgi:hypothetical protein